VLHSTGKGVGSPAEWSTLVVTADTLILSQAMPVAEPAECVMQGGNDRAGICSRGPCLSRRNSARRQGGEKRSMRRPSAGDLLTKITGRDTKKEVPVSGDAHTHAHRRLSTAGGARAGRRMLAVANADRDAYRVCNNNLLFAKCRGTVTIPSRERLRASTAVHSKASARV